MTNENPKDINTLFARAAKVLAQSQQLIDEAEDGSETGSDGSIESQARILQLILEYRLYGQDILAELLALDHHLLYILGIQPQHTAAINMERIAYALGRDDLKEILHALSQLVDALLRIARRYQKHQERTLTRPMKTEVKGSRWVVAMQRLVENQKSFLLLTKEMNEMMSVIQQQNDDVIMLNLKEQTLQLQNIVQNQLTQAQNLYHKFHASDTLMPSLTHLLQKADSLLQIMPSLYQPMPHYQPGLFHNKSTEELEQRAAAKRLRPFF